MKESSLIKFNQEKDKNLQTYGITGKQVEIKGRAKIEIENTLEPLSQVCYVVDSLPRNLDRLVVIPAYSEQVVKCKTLEKGVRFIEHQILQSVPPV